MYDGTCIHTIDDNFVHTKNKRVAKRYLYFQKLI